jgi:hypothetical protein
MIMKWKDKMMCLHSTTHDNKIVPTRVRGHGMEKPTIVTDYNSGMGGVDPKYAYFTSYCSTRKRLKYYQKHISISLISVV